jgi:hypothetical protein
VRAALPAVEAYDADNIGSAGDVDASAATTGYAGMTLALLQSYDGAVKNVVVGSVAPRPTASRAPSAARSACRPAANRRTEFGPSKEARVPRAHLFTGLPVPTGFTP